MIQLHPDYLLLETPQGQIIPCSAELVAVELMGEGADAFDPELVHQAVAAVLHYFREDQGRTTVSVGEFSNALEQALQALGVENSAPQERNCVRSLDLQQLADNSDKAFELTFFPKLRREMKANLVNSPVRLDFHGLRGCVKQLVGAKRWTPRCQRLNDQIVDYLRACLINERTVESCDLIIR